MSDNTILPSGEKIRDVEKTATGAKAQVVMLDLGGGSGASPEAIASGALPTKETYGSIATGQATITSSTSLIVAARPGRKAVKLYNHSSVEVFFGPTGVAPTSGALLPGVYGAERTVEGGAEIDGVLDAAVTVAPVIVSYIEIF